MDASTSFILRGSYTLYGPNCYGETCHIATAGCEKAGGMSISGIFCAIPDASKKPFSFLTDSGEGLPNGIIVILSLLSAIIAMLYWWRKKRLAKKKMVSEYTLEMCSYMPAV